MSFAFWIKIDRAKVQRFFNLQVFFKKKTLFFSKGKNLAHTPNAHPLRASCPLPALFFVKKARAKSES